MAATIARAQGFTKSGDPKNGEVTRLGSGSATAKVATWHTFADVTIYADGSGSFRLTRKSEPIHRLVWGSENVAPPEA